MTSMGTWAGAGCRPHERGPSRRARARETGSGPRLLADLRDRFHQALHFGLVVRTSAVEWPPDLCQGQHDDAARHAGDSAGSVCMARPSSCSAVEGPLLSNHCCSGQGEHRGTPTEPHLRYLPFASTALAATTARITGSAGWFGLSSWAADDDEKFNRRGVL